MVVDAQATKAVKGLEMVDHSASRAWFWRLSALVMIICLCSHFQIYHTAVINNIFTVARPWLLEQYENESSTVEVQWTVMTSAVPFGQFVGTLMSGVIADTFGRKGAYVGLSMLLTISGLMMGFCKMLDMFLLATFGRFLLGVTAGIAINIAVLFIIEAAPKENRGSFSSATQWYYGLGDLLAVSLSLPQLLGTDLLWPLLMAIGCLPAPFLLLALFFCHESSRFLYLSKGKEKQCKEAIRFYQGESNIEETMKDLQAELVALKSSPHMGLMSMLRNQTNRRSLLLACLVNGSGQMTGIAAIMAYSTTMIEVAGFDHNSAAWATFGVGFFKLISGLFPSMLMDTWGRRPMNQIGQIGCCLCHVALMVALWLLPPSRYLGIGVTVVLSLFMAAYTCQSCVVSTYCGELFVQSTRATGLVVSFSFAWLMATVVSFTFLPLITSFGVPFALLPYAIASAASAVVAHFILVETKGLTFTEIAAGIEKSSSKVFAQPSLNAPKQSRFLSA